MNLLTGASLLALAKSIYYYVGYRSATRFMDDAQQRTIANGLQKPNYDHLICYFLLN